MDTKRTIAERIHTIVPELDQEQIVNLLEVPKILTWGTLPFQHSHWLESFVKHHK